MGKFLVFVISWALSSFLLKVAAALGIGLLTYKGLYALVESMIDLIQPLASGLPAAIINIIAIAGVPEGLSIVCSAMLTRAAINASKAFVGVIT